MKKEVQDVLFDCLKDIIYNPDKAGLDLNELPEECQRLGEGMLFLAKCVKEQKLFAKSLVHGDFEENVPSVENGIAAPLKEVHGILKHVVWQTKQVAKGDYNQHLDYFGDFSDSFNTMVHQLKERQESIETEQSKLRMQNRELVNLQDLFKDITINAPYHIIALNASDKDVTYLNKSALRMKENNSRLFDKLYETIIAQKESQTIVMIDDPQATSDTRYYQVSMSGTQNDGSASLLFVIMDVTDDVNAENNLERLAYMDELTGLPNRRYGMNYANKLSEENSSYAVAFVDIDYLKYCNDVFGHEAGDAYIIEVTEALKAICGDELTCRIGGDEFMIIKPNAGKDALSDELKAVREDFIKTRTEPFKKSFSYGVEERRRDDERPNADILASADMKMYSFKATHKRKMDYVDNRK